MALRGWPVLAIGISSLVAALAYMGGPRPIAYTPFGELTVFVFFGLVAVMGTDWVLTGPTGGPMRVPVEFADRFGGIESFEPARVTSPATSNRSFTDIGNPSTGERRTPALRSRSA